MPGLVQQSSAICLGKLASQEQTETCSASATEKRLKDAFRVFWVYARPAVHHLEEGPSTRAESAVPDLYDLARAVRRPVLESVLAQIPDNLAQLGRVNAHFGM